MVQVTGGEDCGNSPKKSFLKQLNISFAENDIDFIVGSVTDDITWNIIGDKFIQGKNDFVGALEQMKDIKTEELIISSIITHGKEGAVNGSLKLENGEKYGFCDVYEFRNTKGSSIKSITSYVIQIRA